MKWLGALPFRTSIVLDVKILYHLATLMSSLLIQINLKKSFIITLVITLRTEAILKERQFVCDAVCASLQIINYLMRPPQIQRASFS